MKTQNAFALKDFDAARILQRDFFLHRMGIMHEDDDANILDIYNVAAISHLGTVEMRRRLDEAQRLRDTATAYAKRLHKHSMKLERLAWRLKGDNQQRAISLRDKYRNAVDKIGSLQKKINALIRDGDKAIQKVFNREVGERIISARQACGLERNDVAAILGISPHLLGYYERGEREPALWTIARLSGILNRSTDWILGTTA